MRVSSFTRVICNFQAKALGLVLLVSIDVQCTTTSTAEYYRIRQANFPVTFILEFQLAVIVHLS